VGGKGREGKDKEGQGRARKGKEGQGRPPVKPVSVSTHRHVELHDFSYLSKDFAENSDKFGFLCFVNNGQIVDSNTLWKCCVHGLLKEEERGHCKRPNH
jgi:hypothetical protein